MLRSLDVGFAAYRKKPEFSGGSIIISDYNDARLDRYKNNNKLFLLEEGSAININGIRFKKNTKNVKDILYGKVYGKKTNK